MHFAHHNNNYDLIYPESNGNNILRQQLP